MLAYELWSKLLKGGYIGDNIGKYYTQYSSFHFFHYPYILPQYKPALYYPNISSILPQYTIAHIKVMQFSRIHRRWDCPKLLESREVTAMLKA